MMPLDPTDRAALAAWIGALWYRVQDVIAVAIDGSMWMPWGVLT